MKNEKLIHDYVYGAIRGTGNSVRIQQLCNGVAKLFSYNTVIAERHTLPCGQVIFFTNDTKYSVTTAKHQSILARAFPEMQWVFPMERIPQGTTELIGHGTNDELAERYTARVNETIAFRMRQAESSATMTRAKAELILGAQTFVSRCNRLQNALGFFYNIEPLPEKLLADANQKVSDLKRKAQTKAANRNRNSIRKLRTALPAWRAGEVNSLPIQLAYDFMRVKGDKLETSRYVSLAVREAVPALTAFVKGKRDNLVGKKVGRYTIQSRLPNGGLKVGCHAFTAGEILRVAKSLGIA